MTFASTLKDDGSVAIPPEAVEALGLHPGDEITVRIETRSGAHLGEPDQAELHRRAALCFEEADRLVREPGKPLSDPMEADWGAAVEAQARKMGLKL